MGKDRAVRKLPREKTVLRSVYDALVSNKGRPVLIDFVKTAGHRDSIFQQLRNFYGLDICSTGRNQYKLVGEYVGRDYVPYNQQPEA